jgi:hypothetical protein
MKEIDRDRRERRKVRRKTRKQAEPTAENTDLDSSSRAVEAGAVDGGDAPMADAQPELEDESVYLEKEKDAIATLVDDEIRRDQGASISALYDLYGMFELPYLGGFPAPSHTSNFRHRYAQGCFCRLWSLHGVRQESAQGG